jgi:uncharacterized protein
LINIGAIKNIACVKKCGRGTIITGDGIGNILFVILKGEIGVYTDYKFPGAEMVSTLGSGDLFADPGLLQDKKAAYTTVTLSEAIIVPIERKSFNDFLQEEPSLVFELIKELYLRLERTTAAYKELIIQHAQPSKNQEKKPEGKKSETLNTTDTKPIPHKHENEPAAVSAAAAVPLVASDKFAGESSFALFPAQHGHYELLVNNDDSAHLMSKSYTCPICKSVFSSLTVKPSKLVLAATDKDMRSRYKGIEPLYYEVLTCPHCLFSALQDSFASPDKSKTDILRELETIKNTVQIDPCSRKDTDSVFAGYYLALFCAPISFSKYQLAAGKLLYKLSRIYQDAGDESMEMSTAQKALDNYLYAYEKTGISPAQEQQICIIIGELYLKQGCLKEAIAFFSKAKSSANSSPAFKSHAENRVYDIREMAAAAR